MQTLVRRFGYDVHKIHAVPEIVPINVLPLVVRDWMERKGPGARPRGGSSFYVVEIGAHDGMHGDPVSPFITKYHWRGVLVEPQPVIFKRLVQNYRREKQLRFENAAIAERDGTAILYAFKESSHLPDHSTMLATFNREALEKNAHGYHGEIEEISVPALTLNSLFAKHKIKSLDLLQIDTEGYDYNIICMLDKTPVKPAILHFESAFMSREQWFHCATLLHKWGYRLLTIGIDTVAYRQPEDEGFIERLANKGY